MPLVIVGLVVIAWLLLAGLPFGGREEEAENQPATETIAEGTTTRAPMTTGTVLELPGDSIPDTTSTTQPPLQTGAPPTATIVEPGAPVATPPAGAAPVRTNPAPARTNPAPARTAPAPVRTTPEPVRTPPPAVQPAPRAEPQPARAAEISEDDAAGTLRGYASGFYRDVSGDCLQIRSHGYRNVGYTFSVWDACVSGGGSRMLGRWRVDSKTREVFRQHDDGRFLRP